jgi:FAD:protein FMN transferase
VYRVEQVMGTTISLHIADLLPPQRLAELGDDVFAFMHEVDARFSTYLAESEVSRIGRGLLDPADATPMLRHVLDLCAELWQATDGFFDAHATGQFDPSGYVKGWAVQVACDRLAEAGGLNHCLNAGGDVRVRGHNPSGQPWRVGVRHPWHADRVCCVLAGTDLAIATSGVYERGHHVIDPFTGRPAHGLRSVTVAGPDLGTADAYATAAVAMGRAGQEWLSTVDGYSSAMVTDDGTFLHSPDLPFAVEP